MTLDRTGNGFADPERKRAGMERLKRLAGATGVLICGWLLGRLIF